MGIPFSLGGPVSEDWISRGPAASERRPVEHHADRAIVNQICLNAIGYQDVGEAPATNEDAW